MALHTFRFCYGFLLLLTAVGLAGCGNSKIGYVEGTVNLDGKPLEGAVVTFIPEKGRPAYGRTNADGWYELQYTREEKGTLIGKNKVTISTERVGDPDSDDPELQKSVPELVPAKYNRKTELTADVESGSNTFDFELSSKGPILSHKQEVQQRPEN